MQVQESCDHVIPANKKKENRSTRALLEMFQTKAIKIQQKSSIRLKRCQDIIQTYMLVIYHFILPLSMFLHPLQSHCSFQNTPTSMLTTYKTSSGLTTKKTFLLHSPLFTQAVIFLQKDATEMLSNKPSSYSNTFHPNHFQHTLQSYLNQRTQRLGLRLIG